MLLLILFSTVLIHQPSESHHTDRTAVLIVAKILKYWYLFFSAIVLYSISSPDPLLGILERMIGGEIAAYFIQHYYLVLVLAGFFVLFDFLPKQLMALIRGALIYYQTKEKSELESAILKKLVQGNPNLGKVGKHGKRMEVFRDLGREKADYPSKYFERLQFANNVIIATVGVTLGLFTFGASSIGIHESKMIVLLLISLLFGILGIIYQITPVIKIKDKDGDLISIPIVTVRVLFGVTYIQLIFALAGYVEAAISLLKPGQILNF